jgi:hypothetical protein
MMFPLASLSNHAVSGSIVIPEEQRLPFSVLVDSTQAASPLGILEHLP